MESSTSQPLLLDRESTGTPANEWALQTTSALRPSTQSSSSTSADELPGAFPSSGEESTASAQGVGGTIVDTARPYLPESMINTMETFLGSSTIKASSNDISHRKSLPSKEILGALPGENVGGVGSLPGMKFESGVANLPDERSQEDGEKSHTIPGYIATAKEALGQLRSTFTGTVLGSTTTDSGHVESDTKVDTSQEGAPLHEDVSGIEPPRPNNELCAARLPDQRKELHSTSAADSGHQGTNGISQIDEDQTSTFAADKQQNSSLVTDPGRTGSASDIAKFDVNDQKAPPKSDLNSTVKGPRRDNISGADGDGYHPAELNPRDKIYPPLSTDDNQFASSDPRPESTRSSMLSHGSPKKVGLRDKVSGGAKVLMGTLGRNKGKVEAGKRILHGED